MLELDPAFILLKLAPAFALLELATALSFIICLSTQFSWISFTVYRATHREHGRIFCGLKVKVFKLRSTKDQGLHAPPHCDRHRPLVLPTASASPPVHSSLERGLRAPATVPRLPARASPASPLCLHPPSPSVVFG
jgi:hypothetical protein